MTQLPLFPLNTVLFPGMPISLHIFEERYKIMIQRCLEETLSFGVVLIDEGAEALGPLARPHRIGCTAQIVQVERLSMGRMNIMAVGKQRFRINSLDTVEPYLRGEIDLIPLATPGPEALLADTRRLRHWVGRYLAALEAAGQTSIVLNQLPEDSLPFGYLAATLLQIPARQKQPLLAAEDALIFLRDLRALYRREVALLDMLLEQPGQSRWMDNRRLN